MRVWLRFGSSVFAVGLALWAVVAIAASVPDAPTGLTATAGDGQVALTWQAPSNTGGSAIDHYTISTTPGGQTQSTSTSATITGLTNGTTYAFSVTATNATGTGLAGTPATATPHGPPGPPTNLSATAGNGQVSLSWSAPASTGGSPIDHYTITGSPGGQSYTSPGGSTSITIVALTNGTTYSFNITATNGASLTSQPATITATPTAPPSPTPTPTNATIGLNPTAGGPAIGITVTGQLFLPGESITLYWDDPSRVAGSAQADSSGGFKVVVKAFPGDAPGVHHLYANVPPNPRADFTLEGLSSPTPPASPAPSDSPSPSASQSRTESPSPTLDASAPGGISGFDIITRPPFVFLPIIGALGLLGVIGYWALSGTRRNRTSALPASVVHRSFRPDYGPPAGGAVAPAAAGALPLSEPIPSTEAPAADAPPTVEPMAPTPAPSAEPFAAEPFAPPVTEAPPPAPPEVPGVPDAPPDLPEPSD